MNVEMFYIVIFESTNEVEVVPANWVKNNTCLWPPYKREDVGKAIRSQEQPGACWIPYKVRVLLSKATYEEARVKLPEAERFTDLTDSEDQPQRRKRRIMKKKLFQDDADSEDEMSGASTLPRPPEVATARMLSPSLPQSVTTGSSENEFIVGRELSPERRYNTTPKLPPRTREHGEHPSSENSRRFLTRTSDSSMLINKRSTDTVTRARNADFSESVIRTILTNQEEIKEQMGILVKLVHELKGTTDESSPLLTEALPIASLDDLQVLEGRLHDEAFKKTLIATLALRGGTAVKDTVWRVMGYLMTNAVARQINWKGVNGKAAFKNLTLRGVITDAIRRNPLTSRATDQDIEQWIRRWLHLAGDRDGGRRARQRLE